MCLNMFQGLRAPGHPCATKPWAVPLLTVFVFVACGDDAATPVESDWRRVAMDSTASLDRRVAAALEGLNFDTCHLDGYDANCPHADYQLSPDHLDQQILAREAILIIDDLGPMMKYLRYRNRILDYYWWNDQVEVEPADYVWRLPPTLGDILVSFSEGPFVPARELEPVGKKIAEVYPRIPTVQANHGILVFSQLAEMAPNHPLVLLEHPPNPLQLAAPDICTAELNVGGEVDLPVLHRSVSTIADQVRTVVAAHNVRFVNASWGDTVATLRATLTRLCPRGIPDLQVIRAILEAMRPIYEVVMATEGVFCAHAAAAEGDPADSIFDVADETLPNRIRFGVYADVNSSVGPLGSPTGDASWGAFPGDTRYVDAYINAGCETLGPCRERGVQYTTDFSGMGGAVLEFPQPSFINPVGLVHFMAVRHNHAQESMSNALVQRIIADVIRACPESTDAQVCQFIDPLYHGALLVEP